MVTIHTTYKIPDDLLAEAQEKANQTGQTHFLAYLKATKDEPLTLTTHRPSIGLAAEIKPDLLTMLRTLISEAGGQIPPTLAMMYPSESGKLELHFEDEIQRIRTPEGQYLWDPSIRRPKHETFMLLLDQKFHLETLRERLSGSSSEGQIASCLGPIVAISLKTSTDTENNDHTLRHLCSRCGMVTRNPGDFCSVCQKYLAREKTALIPELIFVGTDAQLIAMEAICLELQLPVIRHTDPEVERDFVGFLRTDKPSFAIALRHIFEQRTDGWWLQQNALSEHEICTDAQFEAAYHDALSRL